MMRAAPRGRVGAWLLIGLLGNTLAAVAQVAHLGDYEIGPGDVLSVVVIGQAPMTGNFPVDPEGMVNFPILGKIKASQHTTLELERKITTLLADGILKRPQVTVSVAEYASQQVFVTGEVQKPGRYPLKADRTLLALLGDIGALGPDVGHEVIVIRPTAASASAEVGPAVPLTMTDASAPVTAAPEGSRGAPPDQAKTGEGPAAPGEPAVAAAPVVPGLPFVAAGSEVFRVSLLELQSGNPERNITLQAGDTVFFPKASQIYVMGNVARPGPYRYQEGMTVLQVLTLAGGVTDRGSLGRTKVIRIVDGRKVEKKVKVTDPVLPEDTLVVPERFF
jgi:protein involved in polysaccharide export with SLBB domain